MPDNIDEAKLKEAMKEALKEWLDARFAEFGKWALGSLIAALMVGFIYFILWADGWHK